MSNFVSGTLPGSAAEARHVTAAKTTVKGATVWNNMGNYVRAQ
jgi:hypothetical protein